MACPSHFLFNSILKDSKPVRSGLGVALITLSIANRKRFSNVFHKRGRRAKNKNDLPTSGF
jgi:hypothetical protein